MSRHLTLEEIENLFGGISDFPARKRKILRNFDLLLPKFHFILPNFYFPAPWGNFVSSLEVSDFPPSRQKLGVRNQRLEGTPLVSLANSHKKQ